MRALAGISQGSFSNSRQGIYMTKHKGKNKRPGSKHIDTKMSPRKQARKTSRRNHHNYTVEIPERLLRNMKQRQKERR